MDLKNLKLTQRQEQRPTEQLSKNKHWMLWWKKHQAIIVLIMLIALFVIWWVRSSSSDFEYVFGSGLPKSDEGRVNVLLLGISGGTHDGSTLTDTILVAGYDPKTHRIDLISLPRDLWIDSHQAKINTLYQKGLSQGNGLGFAQTEIGTILSTQIPYAVLVDFNGFIKAIDLIAGIDVEVQNSFDDYKYPITGKEKDLCDYKESEIEVDEAKSKELNIPVGKQRIYTAPDGKVATDSAKLDYSCRFEHISFNQGTVHMDGVTALKFVRSRSGTNNEGSDFARSHRQQLVLQAFRSKVLSLGTLTDLNKIGGLIQTLGDSVKSNIPQSKYPALLNAAKQTNSITSHVVDWNTNQNLLIHPDPLKYGGGWVLVPAAADWSGVQQYVNDIFAGVTPATVSATVK